MKIKGSTIAITGATGFIGKNIVRVFLKHGAKVVAVVRNLEKGKELASWGAELRQADLSDKGALCNSFMGCDAVISNAGVISMGQKSVDELVLGNMEGTKNVFEAIKAAGVKRAIMTSSAVVYKSKRGHFYNEDDAVFDNTTKPNRVNGYAVSKSLAEKTAWEIAQRESIELTSFRPHAVYGAYDRSTLTVWFKRFMALPITVLPTHIRYPAVLASDIGEGMRLALEKDVSIGKSYNIAGEPDSFTFWKMLKSWKRVGGKTPLLTIPFPVPLRRRYELDRIKKDLGWENRPLDEGCKEILAWD